MTALVILKLWMIATALFVAPFHRFAAVYVGCYALAVLFRGFGVTEPVVNIVWHFAVLAIAFRFPTMRSVQCVMVWVLFFPLIALDYARLAQLMPDHDTWWGIYWLVIAQLALLPFGTDRGRVSALWHGGFAGWRAARSNDFLRAAA